VEWSHRGWVALAPTRAQGQIQPSGDTLPFAAEPHRPALPQGKAKAIPHVFPRGWVSRGRGSPPEHAPEPNRPAIHSRLQPTPHRPTIRSILPHKFCSIPGLLFSKVLFEKWGYSRNKAKSIAEARNLCSPAFSGSPFPMRTPLFFHD